MNSAWRQVGAFQELQVAGEVRFGAGQLPVDGDEGCSVTV
jgi:hypothetical protein